MTATIVALPSRQPDARYGDDVDLRTLIRQGDQVHEPITYSEDTWNLAGCADLGDRDTAIRFGGVPERWRDAVKDYVLLIGSPGLALDWAPGSSVAEEHASRGRASSWGNARTEVSRLVAPLRILEELGLRQLEADDWSDFAQRLIEEERPHPKAGKVLSRTREGAMRCGVSLRRLHDLGEVHGRVNPFGTRPWGFDELNSSFGHEWIGPGERRNATRPHGDVFAMVGACLNLLHTCADDVIERVSWWSRRSQGSRRPDEERAYLHPDEWRASVETWTREVAADLPVRSDEGGGWLLAHEVVSAYSGRAGLLYDYERCATAVATAPVTDPRMDPFLVSHPGRERAQWLTDSDHLVPTIRDGGGLWWWSDRLVFAAYYVIAGIVGLRRLEIDALEPGCLVTVADGHRMRGHKIKNQSIANPPSADWIVNDHVAVAVDVVERLAEAMAATAPAHPRHGWPVLFHRGLLRSPRRRGKATTLSGPLTPVGQSQWLVPAMTKLHQAGAGCDVSELTLVNHRTIRATCLDAHVDRPLGDLAAVAVGKWSSLDVAYGYVGHRPRITTPAFRDEVAEHRLARGDVPNVVRAALDDPGSLSGKGADELVENVHAEPGIANGPVTVARLKSRLRNGSLTSVSVGTLSACVKPQGGLCGSQREADHRLCQVGCQNMVLTPYHRARLELMRRQTERLLGRNARLTAKLDQHDDLVVAERQLTDDELIDVVTASWDPRFRELVTAIIPGSRS